MRDIITMQAKEGWGQEGSQVHIALQGRHSPLQAGLHATSCTATNPDKHLCTNQLEVPCSAHASEKHLFSVLGRTSRICLANKYLTRG